jgi:hypothetical protein
MDEVAAGVGAAASQRVSIDVETIPIDEGRTFIAISVNEFEEYPIVCRIDRTHAVHGEGRKSVLRKGALYVRGATKPETIEASDIELRELLQLAIDKGVRAFLARAARAGLNTSGTGQPSDIELFDEQLEDFDS